MLESVCLRLASQSQPGHRASATTSRATEAPPCATRSASSSRDFSSGHRSIGAPRTLIWKPPRHWTLNLGSDPFTSPLEYSRSANNAAWRVVGGAGCSTIATAVLGGRADHVADSSAIATSSSGQTGSTGAAPTSSRAAASSGRLGSAPGSAFTSPGSQSAPSASSLTSSSNRARSGASRTTESSVPAGRSSASSNDGAKGSRRSLSAPGLQREERSRRTVTGSSNNGRSRPSVSAIGLRSPTVASSSNASSTLLKTTEAPEASSLAIASSAGTARTMNTPARGPSRSRPWTTASCLGAGAMIASTVRPRWPADRVRISSSSSSTSAAKSTGRAPPECGTAAADPSSSAIGLSTRIASSCGT